jgi:hypothetical protein
MSVGIHVWSDYVMYGVIFALADVLRTAWFQFVCEDSLLAFINEFLFRATRTQLHSDKETGRGS